MNLPAVQRYPLEPHPPDRAALEAALARHPGNVSRAARELGLSRQALYRRMEPLSLKTDA